MFGGIFEEGVSGIMWTEGRTEAAEGGFDIKKTSVLGVAKVDVAL